MTPLLRAGRFRDVARALPEIDPSPLLEGLRAVPPAEEEGKEDVEPLVRRAYFLLSLFANSWVWMSGEANDTLPDCIARPLVAVAAALDMPPLLTHASIVLYNWRLLQPGAPIRTQSLAPLHLFLGGADESFFFLITAEIEAIFGQGLPSLWRAQDSAAHLLALLSSAGDEDSTAGAPEDSDSAAAADQAAEVLVDPGVVAALVPLLAEAAAGRASPLARAASAASSAAGGRGGGAASVVSMSVPDRSDAAMADRQEAAARAQRRARRASSLALAVLNPRSPAAARVAGGVVRRAVERAGRPEEREAVLAAVDRLEALLPDGGELADAGSLGAALGVDRSELALGAWAARLAVQEGGSSDAGASAAADEAVALCLGLISSLVAAQEAVALMRVAMQSMPQGCDPYIFYHRVRPFLAGWKANPRLPNGVVYGSVDVAAGVAEEAATGAVAEGAARSVGSDSGGEEPAGTGQPPRRQYYGGSAAQSSTVAGLDAALGVAFPPDSPQGRFLAAMRAYMPPGHRRFVELLARRGGLRQWVLAVAAATGESVSAMSSLREEGVTLLSALLTAMDSCLEELSRFRSAHVGIVRAFIMKQQQPQPTQSAPMSTPASPGSSSGSPVATPPSSPATPSSGTLAGASPSAAAVARREPSDSQWVQVAPAGSGVLDSAMALLHGSGGAAPAAASAGDMDSAPAGAAAAAGPAPSGLGGTAGGKGTGGTPLLEFLLPLQRSTRDARLGAPPGRKS